MKNIKKILSMIKCNFWSFVGFEFIYKLLTFLVVSPLLLNNFSLIMNIRGYKYLTSENLNSFILNPISIILSIILIFIIAFYTMYNITTIILIIDASYQNKNIKILDIMKVSLKKTLSILKPINFPIVLVVFLINPLLNMGLTTSLFSTIKVPEYLFEYILSSKTYLVMLGVFLFLLAFIMIKWIYALYYFILEDDNLYTVLKRSKRLCKRKHLLDIINIIITQGTIYGLYILFVLFGILIVYGANYLLKDIVIFKTLTTTIIWVFMIITFFLFTVLSTPISYSVLGLMFYNHKNKINENIRYFNYRIDKDDDKADIIFKRILYVVICICLVVGFLFTYGVYSGRYNLNINNHRELEVTAHRGDSKNYPENTMSAFISAKIKGADYIELDVHETSDGKIVVMHDSNLKRTTKLDKNIWEVRYDDIKNLDAGSFFNKKYKNERIPLFEDVVKWCKTYNIKLNIEIKPTGHDEDIEKKVIDIINKFNFKDDCVITSQVYDTLVNLKMYDSNINTVYVLGFAYGNISVLDKADNFSIEATSVNSKLVKSVHKNGKKLYVWTVNSDNSIKKMINLKVDNIITDNVSNAKNIIFENKHSNLINEYIKYVEMLFL